MLVAQTTDELDWWLGVQSRGNLGVLLDNDQSYVSSTSVVDGAWHHVAATRHATGLLVWYVDGVPVASFASTVTPSGDVQDLTIGCVMATAGVTFFAQHWITDPAGPSGLPASNGSSGTEP